VIFLKSGECSAVPLGDRNRGCLGANVGRHQEWRRRGEAGTVPKYRARLWGPGGISSAVRDP